MLRRPVEPHPVKNTFPPFFKRAQHGFLDALRPAGLGERPILADHVAIGLEQQAQRGADVALGGFTQVGGDRVGRFGRQDAKLELVADLEEFFGTPVGGFAHEGVAGA